MKPTPEQAAVITSDAKNILCVAGPGSGKSYTIIQRILRLIATGVEPNEICVITYTNEAAGVIHERLNPASGAIAITLGFIGTLHSFCLRHLQTFGGMKDVTVLDDDEADEELVRSAARSGIKASWEALERAREQWDWSKWMTPQTFRGVELPVAKYYREMKATNTLDFNAILMAAFSHLMSPSGRGGAYMEPSFDNEILRDDTPLPTEKQEPVYQRKWKHLMVDEAHDSSIIDMMIYAAIDHENTFMVCDSDQAIFGFRGGNVRGVLALAEAPDWSLFKLEGNFRSTQEICDAATRLVEHNADRIPKRMVSLRLAAKHHPAVETVTLETDNMEAAEIAAGIRARLLDGQLPTEIAVLTRTNSVAEEIAKEIEAHGVPVRKQVKAQLPTDWRFAKAALRMLQARTEDAIRRYLRLAHGIEIAEQIELDHATGKGKLEDGLFTKLEMTVGGVIRDLVRLGVSAESVERIEAKWEGMSPESTLGDLVLALGHKQVLETRGEGVFCSTVHQAKGKEWETVIIAGCEEGVFPLTHGDTNEAEERRCFFVALTRAKNAVLMTRVESRRAPWGPREHQRQTASRFIDETLGVKSENETKGMEAAV